MKIKKLCALAISMAVLLPAVFAQEIETIETIEESTITTTTTVTESTSTSTEPEQEKQKPYWAFSTTTDFAYYPLSAPVVSDSTHFAPITGPYSGLEGRVIGAANFIIPVPMGSNWLVSGATLNLTANIEITPVTLKPGLEVTWTPLPFLVFTAGAQAGTGWNLFGLQGMALYNETTNTYEDLPSFQKYFLKWFAQGTFQFDTGAIWSGDWTHVQMMYTYQCYYEGLASVPNQDLWIWQCSGNRTNGLCNYQSIILAYAMPLTISRVGVMCEIDGHYNANDYEFGSTYNGNFKSISISPLAQFTFGAHDGLSMLVGFQSRRGYTTEVTDGNKEPFMTFANREFFLNRIAFSWSHNF